MCFSPNLQQVLPLVSQYDSHDGEHPSSCPRFLMVSLMGKQRGGAVRAGNRISSLPEPPEIGQMEFLHPTRICASDK